MAGFVGTGTEIPRYDQIRLDCETDDLGVAPLARGAIYKIFRTTFLACRRRDRNFTKQTFRFELLCFLAPAGFLRSGGPKNRVRLC